MRPRATLLSLLSVLVLVPALPFAPAPARAAGADAPRVRVALGMLQGLALDSGGAAFLGVPYAAPPTGPLRWRAPVPAGRWRGTRDARSFGAACMQQDAGWNHSLAASGSEDCLTLNVWTPRPARAARLPVLVWIHGGGFVAGGANDPVFSGERLADRGLVVVTLNYRLGVLGFLAHAGLRTAGDHGGSGNYGLLDQLAALHWVQANIDRFGGDPRAVTVAGQSAGGMSVVALLASPLAKGLFRHAIVESGVTLTGMPVVQLAAAEENGARFAGDLPIGELRSLPAATLLDRWQRFAAATPGGAPGLVVDGHALPDDPARVFARHGQQPVPLLVGNNARERLAARSDATLADALRLHFGPQAPAALALYGVGAADPGPADPVLGTPAEQWATDSSFRCAAVATARAHAGAGHAVYAYQFEQPLPGRSAQGAAHSYELPYVFGNLLPDGPLGAAYGPPDRELSALMVAFWSNFVKHGDPNGPALPAWPRSTPDDPAFVRFSSALPGGVAPGTGLRDEQCRLLLQRAPERSPR